MRRATAAKARARARPRPCAAAPGRATAPPSAAGRCGREPWRTSSLPGELKRGEHQAADGAEPAQYDRKDQQDHGYAVRAREYERAFRDVAAGIDTLYRKRVPAGTL